MSEPDDTDVKNIDRDVLRDLESKYADVACPIHATPPKFELQEDGSVVERMCCATLLQIVRELQVQAGERPAADAGPAKEPEGR